MNKLNDRLKEIKIYLDKTPTISDWDINKINAVYEEFFKRSPFSVGKEVVLIKTPEINEKDSWGWMGSKHFLKKGNKGKIVEIDFSSESKKILLFIEMYNQTWKDSDGTEHNVDRPACFMFSEDWVQAI